MRPAVRIVTFKIYNDLLEELDSVSKKEGKTRSEVIREAIELYLQLKGYRAAPPKYVRLLS